MSFPLSPTNGQTTVLNGITYAFNVTDSAWVRVTGILTALPSLTVTGSLVVNGSLVQANIPLVLNDLSGQCDGKRAVFALKTDQTAVTGIVDSKDLEVLVNGIKLAPYVTERRYPWFTPYDSSKGFKVVTTGTTANWLVIHNAPELSSQVTVTQLNSSASKQTRRYPYSATTIALGD